MQLKRVWLFRWKSITKNGQGKRRSWVGYSWVDLLLTMLWCLPSGKIAKKFNDQIYRKVQDCWFWAKNHAQFTQLLGTIRIFFKIPNSNFYPLINICHPVQFQKTLTDIGNYSKIMIQGLQVPSFSPFSAQKYASITFKCLLKPNLEHNSEKVTR